MLIGKKLVDVDVAVEVDVLESVERLLEVEVWELGFEVLVEVEVVTDVDELVEVLVEVKVLVEVDGLVDSEVELLWLVDVLEMLVVVVDEVDVL